MKLENNIPNRIFLVGPMGAGKSTVGKYLADLLDYAFLDADKEIEKHTGASISWIFDKEGEAGFRKREETMISTLTQKKHCVLATGGGAVLSATNRNLLSSRGFVIYIQASIDVLIKRTAKDKNRPLLQKKNKKKIIKDLLNEREPLYLEVADLVVETKDTSAKEMGQKMYDALKKTASN